MTKPKLTKHRAQVYSIIVNLIIKTIFAFAAIGVFIAVAVKMLMIPNPTWETVGPYAAFDTLLGISVYLVFKHYFPANSNSE